MSPGDISRKKVGSWFDENMTMVTHKAASFHLYNMGILEIKYLTSEANLSLVHAIVMGRLDYCNSLIFNTPATHIAKLQHIQNYAAGLVCWTPKFYHITPDINCSLFRPGYFFRSLLLGEARRPPSIPSKSLVLRPWHQNYPWQWTHHFQLPGITWLTQRDLIWRHIAEFSGRSQISLKVDIKRKILE